MKVPIFMLTPLLLPLALAALVSAPGARAAEHVVQFGHYAPAAELGELALSLLPAGGPRARVVDRGRLAAGFPTDFVVLDVPEGSDGALEHLERAPAVRYVGPNAALRAPLATAEPEEEHQDPRRKLMRVGRPGVTAQLSASELWSRGFSGAGVRVAVFDTGLNKDHPHFRNVKERTNWTSEKSLDDGIGHGSFVAGVIASQSDECPGFAPDAELYIFRVFTSKQVSYTSWFLDAFNYAIFRRVHVLNLSIGGPDFNDRPFTDKVLELSANGVLVVSAIGNDGPLYGTLNNPADQPDVIGVGGINDDDHIASFSSRGMTTWELPYGYGRVKPDLVTYGQSVVGSKVGNGCRKLSGTSVASPVVAGAVALLCSTVADWSLINPASMKQALVESARRLPSGNIFEQGMGKLDLVGAAAVLADYAPRTSLLPPALDLTDSPYMWPYSEQPLYHSALPVLANVTVLNGMGVAGYFGDAAEARWEPGANGELLEVRVELPDVVWPWTGCVGVRLSVAAAGAGFTGVAEGELVLPPLVSGDRRGELRLPVRARIVPTPARSKRVLWDQAHSIRYPSGYLPRDNLQLTSDMLDWNGDSLHTNFRGVFTALRNSGRFVEILPGDWTCFDASLYGALLLVDPEDEYFPAEVAKLERDVREGGLALVVLADWYNSEVMARIRFFDDNTRSWWTPVTGGANVPALNDVLGRFGLELSARVLQGTVHGRDSLTAGFKSGTSVRRAPAGARLLTATLSDQGNTMLKRAARDVTVPVMAAVPAGAGRVVVYGDSNAVDAAHASAPGFWLLEDVLNFALLGDVSATSMGEPIAEPFVDAEAPAAARVAESELWKYSYVMGGFEGMFCPALGAPLGPGVVGGGLRGGRA